MVVDSHFPSWPVQASTGGRRAVTVVPGRTTALVCKLHAEYCTPVQNIRVLIFFIPPKGCECTKQATAVINCAERGEEKLDPDILEAGEVQVGWGGVGGGKVCNLVVLKTTGSWRLFFKFLPVGGGGKFFDNR